MKLNRLYWIGLLTAGLCGVLFAQTEDTPEQSVPVYSSDYRGVYTNRTGRIINFYNPSDYALATGTLLSLPTNWEWRTPISFYGRVVDERGNSVSGTTIEFGWTDLSPEGYSRATTTSDDAGLFSLDGRTGKHLSVRVAKDGYYTSKSNRSSFFYAGENENFTPDSRNPVLFSLRKKGKGANLITSEKGVRPRLALRVPSDNVPVKVDLFEKQSSSSGQLEIRKNKEVAEWSLGIEIPDGGLVESSEEFQFEAPEEGYQPVVKFNLKEGEANWTPHINKRYYVAFGQPRKYGWLRVEASIDQETVFLEYAINPDGSRYLEPK